MKRAEEIAGEILAPPRATTHLLEYLAQDRKSLVAGLTTASGDAYLAWLVTFLRDSLGVDHAFVAELAGEDWERLQTVAFCSEQGLHRNLGYEYLDTPCGEVLQQNIWHFAEGVASEFPAAHLLQEAKADSYVGVSLADPSGRPLGLLAVYDRQPMDEQRVVLVRDALSLFRPRTEAEMGRRRALRELSAIAESCTPTPDADPLHSLVLQLAHAMHVKLAFVCESLDREARRLRTVALCIDGRIADVIEYQAAGTPCEHTYGQGNLFIKSGVQARYPEDEFLAQTGVEAYLAIAFFDAEGEPLGHLGIMHDRPLRKELMGNPLFRVFAERAAAELQRRAAEEHRRLLEKQVSELQKTESLGLLAGGIAHDFNNLLTSILGNIEMARMKMPADAREQEFLGEAVRASARAAQLCSQMLAYAGRGQLSSTTVKLNAVVEEMLGLLKVSIPATCCMALEAARHLPTIFVDVSQLQQVVMNLITNAAEALGEAEGVVKVLTGSVFCSKEDLCRMRLGSDLQPGDYVFLEVRDTGCGMDQATRSRIFDPFFTTKAVGHGLGLAALAGIMRRHRGAVDVKSEPGAGTSVTVYIPVSSCKTECSDDGGKQPEPTDLLATVLVVDDDRGVRNVARRLLESAGARVLTASGGQDAVELFARCATEVDCVLLDLTMPGMDGEETLAKLRETRMNIPAIIASGYAETEVLDRLGNQDLVAVIHKPYGRTALIELVREVASGPA